MAQERRGCFDGVRSAEKVLCISDKSGAWSRLAHVCGPDVILTASVKGAREGARVKIMSVGCPKTAGQASRSGEGLAVGRRGEVGGGAIIKAAAFMI